MQVATQPTYFPSPCAAPDFYQASDSINELPVPLDRYLEGLNVGDALDSFTQLADLILASDCDDQSTSSVSDLCPQSPPFDKNNNSPPLSVGSQWLSSPSTFSNSPSPSDIRTWSPSIYSQTSASHYSGPSSVASFSSSNTGTTEGKKSRGGRKSKNAFAASRYRERVKGQQCGLIKQMQREQERNLKLRQAIESKLALYQEFVTLLAQNTSQYDQTLASLGLNSLQTVLSENSSQVRAGDCFKELESQAMRFQQILAVNAVW